MIRASPLWVHAASAGDVLAVAPLCDRLGAPARVSVVTATGAAMARRRWPAAPVTRRLWWPGAAARAARAERPALLLVERLELWPPLLAGAAAAGARVAIVNARLSARSLARYRRVRALFARALAAVDLVCARDPEAAARFVALGVPAARVRVTGSTKYDAPPPPPGARRQQRALIAASTHRGEERALLPALRALAREGWRVTVAPRYPRRARALGRLLGPGIEVLSTVGDLGARWPEASVAFVGGSLVPRGGHNLLEPAACGVPVLFGPHVASVAEEAASLAAAGAGHAVRTAAELLDAASALDADPTAAGRARTVADTFRGATDRCLAALAGLC